MKKKNKPLRKQNAVTLSAKFPISISPNFVGKAQEISSFQLATLFENPKILSQARGSVSLPEKGFIEKDFSILWSKLIIEHKGLKYIPTLIRLKEKDIDLLIDTTFKTYKFNKQFVILTKRMVKYLESIKDKFDEFDKTHPLNTLRISFLEENKVEIFNFLDNIAQQIWELVKDLPKNIFREYQRYFQFMIFKYFVSPSEINTHIYKKPYGYAGDFVMMDYIYDYHANNYLGTSTYSKLLNNFACNIPISSSNILRKNYLKERILELISSYNNSKILSIGSGSGRELFEILMGNYKTNQFVFNALDFEEDALNNIKAKADGYNLENRKVSINYFNCNIIELIRKSELSKRLESNNLVYVSGVFDYLSDRIARKLISKLYKLLQSKGTLIIFNISCKDNYFKAFYELFGDWIMFHRNKEEILSWIENLNLSDDLYEIKDCSNYWLLTLRKP